MSYTGDGLKSFAGAGRKDRVPPRRGVTPPFSLGGGTGMRELSIFVDESGDFGPYKLHSPFYIVTLMFFASERDLYKSYLKAIHKKRF